MGVPMIISKPHFLDADQNLLKAVEGLKPVKKLHDNFLQFEMVSLSAWIWNFSRHIHIYPDIAMCDIAYT